MKQLYIRAGNSKETERILILGEEQDMGERDFSGYRPSKGAPFEHLVETDPYSGGKRLTYIHITPNIVLDSPLYSRDYDVHEFVKHHCRDLVTWDGESTEGLVRSREAFIVNEGLDVELTAQKLFQRLEAEIHHKSVPYTAFKIVEKKAIETIRKEYKIDDLEKVLRLTKNLVSVVKKLKK